MSQELLENQTEREKKKTGQNIFTLRKNVGIFMMSQKGQQLQRGTPAQSSNVCHDLYPYIYISSVYLYNVLFY